MVPASEVPALVLDCVYQHELAGQRHLISQGIADHLQLDVATVEHAIRRLIERSHLIHMSFSGPGGFLVRITEAGRLASEAASVATAPLWKQEVHGTANIQQGNHNTLNYYLQPLTELREPLPKPQVSTPRVKFSIQRVGEHHLGVFLANLNPYDLLLESLRFSEQPFDLRAFEWNEPPAVRETLPPTSRTYLATLNRPQITVPGVPFLPEGRWILAARFVTTNTPEIFEAQVTCEATLATDWTALGELAIIKEQVVTLPAVNDERGSPQIPESSPD